MTKKIHHPKKGGDKVYYHFTAFGLADGARGVRAVLTQDGRNGWHFTGYTLQQPDVFGHWIAHFVLDLERDLGLPRPKDDHDRNRVNEELAKRKYTVTAYDIDSPAAGFDQVTGITIHFPDREIQVCYPVANDTVPTTFWANGTTDGSGQMGGGMEFGTGQGAAGTVVQNPPDWIIKFQNLVAGSPYTLLIGQVGEASVQVGNLTVQA